MFYQLVIRKCETFSVWVLLRAQFLLHAVSFLLFWPLKLPLYLLALLICHLRLAEFKISRWGLKGVGGTITHTSVSSSSSLPLWLSEPDRKSSKSSSDSGRNMSGRRVWDFFSNFEATLVSGLTPSPPPVGTMDESSFYARVAGPTGCPVPHLPHTARKPISLAFPWVILDGDSMIPGWS